MKLLVVIVSYRVTDLTIDCLRSLSGEIGRSQARVSRSARTEPVATPKSVFVVPSLRMAGIRGWILLPSTPTGDSPGATMP